ncbi:MAG TPA: hypothetical protein VN878_01065, partial [Usitatibacter sp.]|nr:hypothetical protein [Usitatibacter sp.]
MQQALSAWIARRSAPGFWQIYRFDRALRRKLTPAGWLIASLLIASAVFGLNTKETLIYQLFGLSLGLLVVAALSSYHFSPPITISRALPRVATAGVEFEYALTVKNLGDKPYEALEMAEVLESERPDARQFAAFKAREDRTRNFFDRLVGYPRWVSLMRLTLGAHIEAPALPALAARGQCSI